MTRQFRKQPLHSVRFSFGNSDKPPKGKALCVITLGFEKF